MRGLPTERTIHTVSAIVRAARLLLEEHFGTLWIEGEVSNFRRPASGHWYFTLKDANAQLTCAMFAGRNRAIRTLPRDGDRVLLRGRLGLYEARGDFQFVAEHLEPAGAGALKAAFEALRDRLAAEGLFDADRKRPLPTLPTRLAVISSGSGAALRDVLHVIERRFPALEVILLPVAVQGDAAGPEIIDALARVPATHADVVLLTRGGGSLEDLWAFNLETVARAVAACPIPTVSAIGHQTDFTITDFVADVRAPTPSAGAELITPDRLELQARFDVALTRITRALAASVGQQQRHVGHLRARLVSPEARLQQRMQRADELEERLLRAVARHRSDAANRLASALRALMREHPARRIAPAQARLDTLGHRLHANVARNLEQRRDALHGSVRALQALSPLATLGRGYAVITEPAERSTAAESEKTAASARTASLKTVTSIAGVRIGQPLAAHLADGLLEVRVEGVHTDHGLPQLPEFDDH